MAKRFLQSDVDNIFLTACRVFVPWSDILPQDCLEFVELFAKANNCGVDLIISGLLTLTSTLAGPGTQVESSRDVFNTSLNLFFISPSAPGGGKSNAFRKVVKDVLDDYQNRHDGRNIHLESYTAAGIQVHQKQNEGYGLITSDEGGCILSSIKLKQSKGESERAVLCKFWGGCGYHVTLSTGERGFKSTSLSLLCYVQPYKMFEELSHIAGDDGFIDRLLILVQVPRLQFSKDLRLATETLNSGRVQNFRRVFQAIDEIHEEEKCRQYILSEPARDVFEDYCDAFVTFMQEKWNPNRPARRENDQEDAMLMSSKDSTHVLRLAVNLHILTSVLSQILAGVVPNVPLTVETSSVEAAKKLYHCIQQQKSIVLQAVRNIQCQETARLPKVQTVLGRVVKAVANNPGPVVVTRTLVKNMHGIGTEQVKLQLQQLERAGLGFSRDIKTGRNTKRLFFKAVMSEAVMKVLTEHGLQHDVYQNRFNEITEEFRNVCLDHHPQAEAIQQLWQ